MGHGHGHGDFGDLETLEFGTWERWTKGMEVEGIAFRSCRSPQGDSLTAQQGRAGRADRTTSKTTAAATGKTKGEVEIGRPESYKTYRAVC